MRFGKPRQLVDMGGMGEVDECDTAYRESQEVS